MQNVENIFGLRGKKLLFLEIIPFCYLKLYKKQNMEWSKQKQIIHLKIS